MKNEIHYSPEALHDLDGIWEYIMIELCNPDAAGNEVENIMAVIDKLADFAEMDYLRILFCK